MCGIIGCLFREKTNVNRILLDGLVQLQNRGYDSAGLCCINNNNYNLIKEVSDNILAIDKLEKDISELNIESNIGIGHTRWATHGAKTIINSHPHISHDGKFMLVHNGIIENYEQLKKKLIEKNICFKTETDTEVIVNSISYYYSLTNNIIESIKKTLSDCQGTWGIVVMCLDTPNKLFISRHGSPLLISYTKEFALVTSEQSGFQNKVNNYIALSNNDIATLEIVNDEIIFNNNSDINYSSLIKKVIKNDSLILDSKYDHWTLKEIYEQPDSIHRAMSCGGRILSNYEVKLGGLEEYKNILSTIDNIIFLGCGTSYHSGMLGMQYFKDLCNFNTVQLFDGSDFNEKDIPKNGKTGLILISQSGETKDLHRCIKIGRKKDLILIGVVNVVDSLIAREVDCGCYLNAGREVGVASTKAFTSQCIVLSLMSMWFSQIHNINLMKRKKMIDEIRKLPYQIKSYLDTNNIQEYIEDIKNSKSLFVLGKGKSEAVAKEGALKIKEISYIHAEAYSSSALKHGPFALLEKNFPVILINPNDEHRVKSNNAKEEIKSRESIVFDIGSDINIPINNSYQELLNIIPLQLFAYYLSVIKGYNPDKPKNLAKVVTVE